MISVLLLAVPLLASLLQLTWMPHLAVLGGFPSLPVVAIVCWTWVRGTRHGLLWALAAGFVLDLGSTGPFGPHALALACAAYAAGLLAGLFDEGLAVLPAAAAFATAVYVGALLVIDDTLRIHGAAASSAVGATIASAVFDAGLAPLLMLLVRRVEPHLRLSEARPW